MSELNPSQQIIADTHEGMIVVDAGPGTGKTHTIVRRYVNIISRDDVDPRDVLLLTFTKNAAKEMEERIKSELSGFSEGSDEKQEEMRKKARMVETGTFDAFCLSVVMDAPEYVSEFFKLDEKLTRNVHMYENETLNKEYFSRMYDQFIIDRYEDYGDAAVIAAGHSDDMYEILSNLMSLGVMPLKKGWFGDDDGNVLHGGRASLLNAIRRDNVPGKNKKSKLMSSVNSKMGTAKVNLKTYNLPFEIEDLAVPDELLEEAVMDERRDLIRLVHDIYYEYIRKSVSDNRLTFGLCATFAFVILVESEETRRRKSYRYLMIDEFQDTNGMQLMMSLMLLKEPNLCVVGDWKQGIYGFRYVSVENITDFEERCRACRKFLNEDIDGLVRVPFSIPEAERLPLEVNYRSSQTVVDASFRSLRCKARKEEALDTEKLDRDIVLLRAENGEMDGHTEIEFLSAPDRKQELDAVLCKVDEYVNSGRYSIFENGVARAPTYSDIAVLCKSNQMCRAIRDRAVDVGMPAFLQGDVDIMSTREGKLALAWLRYVNNGWDMNGICAIMADSGYTLADMVEVKRDRNMVPRPIAEQQKKLRGMQRRVTELLTGIFGWYGLNNDLTQSIITTLSTAHRNSLLTISDLIRLIEEDIANGTTYNVDAMLDHDAFMVQTMHKSKGLEYPIVIIAGLDYGVLPSYRTDSGTLLFNKAVGIRSTKEVADIDGFKKIVNSWKYLLVKGGVKPDYDEQRRLLFVAVSRAKQYATLMCSNNGSIFMKEMAGTDEIPRASIRDLKSIRVAAPALTRPPEVPAIVPRRRNIGVHDLLDFEDARQESDEVCGKGAEYGERVHEEAQRLAEGKKPGEELEELVNVRKVLDRVSGAEISTEVPCMLPIDGMNVTLRGVIDLLAVYPDRIEVHDYKSDASNRFEGEYRIQLSVYAHAASGYYGKPARCFIDYVSPDGGTVEFDPLPMATIESRVREIVDKGAQ